MVKAAMAPTEFLIKLRRLLDDFGGIVAKILRAKDNDKIGGTVMDYLFSLKFSPSAF